MKSTSTTQPIMRSGRPNNKAYKFNATDAIQDGYIWALWPNTLFMTGRLPAIFSSFM